MYQAVWYAPLNLESAHAFFRVEDLPEHIEPSLERIFRVLKDCSADDAKAVILARLAEPMERPRFHGIDFFVAAMRTADHAISPAVLQHELLAGIIRRESFHQLAERHHE
jgi:hypothetical protein